MPPDRPRLAREDVGGKRLVVERSVDGGAQVRLHDLLVYVHRHRALGVHVGADVHRRRVECDRVDERDAACGAALDQVGAKHGGTTDVVADDAGRLEAPTLEQLGQQPPLGGIEMSWSSRRSESP
jgi:hypothetical protein